MSKFSCCGGNNFHTSFCPTPVQEREIRDLRIENADLRAKLADATEKLATEREKVRKLEASNARYRLNEVTLNDAYDDMWKTLQTVRDERDALKEQRNLTEE